MAIDFVESDMRAFIRPDTFDLALNFFTSFGYFEDAQDDLRVLQNVHASLKAGHEIVDDWTRIKNEWLAFATCGCTARSTAARMVRAPSA